MCAARNSIQYPGRESRLLGLSPDHGSSPIGDFPAKWLANCSVSRELSRALRVSLGVTFDFGRSRPLFGCRALFGRYDCLTVATLGSRETLPTADPAAVEKQLARYVASPQFASSGRLSAFLEFVVRKTLAGEGSEIKEYTVGTQSLTAPSLTASGYDRPSSGK